MLNIRTTPNAVKAFLVTLCMGSKSRSTCHAKGWIGRFELFPGGQQRLDMYDANIRQNDAE